MKKLFVSDLDGTVLLQGETKVKKRILDLIVELDENQQKFVVASGRSYGALKRFFSTVLYQMYFICENGALIEFQGKTLYKNAWKRRQVEEIIGIIQKCEYDWVAAGVHTMYTESRCESIVKIYQKEGIPIMKVRSVKELPEDIVRISILHTDPNIEADIRDELKLNNVNDAVISYCDNTWLDIVREDTNKATALEWLLKNNNIDKEEVLAFGDNVNDIEMLKCVPNSYAMEWANREIKVAASYETNCVLSTINENK